jgi:hypothetical protein
MEETQAQLQVEEPKMAGLPLQLLEDIVSYLKTKPHVEVDPYIRAINEHAKVIKITAGPSK